MKKMTMIAGAVVMLAGFGWGLAGAEDAKPADATPPAVKKQTVCPVMGGQINTNSFFDHNGKRIYMCCSGCRPALKADPEKYIRKMESEGITLAPAPVKTNAPAATPATPGR